MMKIFFFACYDGDRFLLFLSWSALLFYLSYFTSGFASSAGSEDEDDEGLDPAVKVVKEKERRQANNARER